MASTDLPSSTPSATAIRRRRFRLQALALGLLPLFAVLLLAEFALRFRAMRHSPGDTLIDEAGGTASDPRTELNSEYISDV